MIAYLDASVALRLILREPEPLARWRDIERVVASALTEVECLRTLDRLAHLDKMSAADLATKRAAVYDLLEAVEIVAIGPSILRRASQPYPSPLGTLDALHLATAMSWQDMSGQQITFATHDRALAVAARASGFDVVGA